MTDPADNRVLVQFAHPALERSRVNRELAEAIRHLPGVTFNDLYEEYPDFDIDIAREQQLLVEHPMIIFQQPFYWYSTPALVKQWEELVLEHGWAYGSEGHALEGKKVLCVITTGGREEAYRAGGHNRYTMDQFLRPSEQTFKLCRMEWLPPFIVHGTHGMRRETIESHARDLQRTIEALRDDRIDLAAARTEYRLNQNLDELIVRSEGAS